jgi:hypothetical protein
MSAQRRALRTIVEAPILVHLDMIAMGEGQAGLPLWARALPSQPYDSAGGEHGVLAGDQVWRRRASHGSGGWTGSRSGLGAGGFRLATLTYWAL